MKSEWKILMVTVICVVAVIGIKYGGKALWTYSKSHDVKPTKIIKEEDELAMGENVAYFAGGCFWGMEKFMDAVPGVTNVVSGYANGDETKFGSPTYELVCSGQTGYKEAVRVEYGPKLSYEMLVRAYYIAIDPTVANRQGNDVGEQYQTGIYYLNEEQKEVAERVSDEVRAQVENFAVEIEAFNNFYEAEEYHQNYLVKNPMGYCHISDEEIEEMKEMFDTERILRYEKPSEEKIKAMLTPEQYEVTQNAGTEAPFKNEYWQFFEKGLYVDIVTGEPLFTSENKYQSSCGWPAFSYSENKNIQYIEDLSFGMKRVEVRSGSGDTHLGHVFENDPESPSGVRYCINSASLKFIPYEDLEKEGYGDTLSWFSE